jgi:hypothetical protein
LLGLPVTSKLLPPEALLGLPVTSELLPPEAFALDGKTARGSFDDLDKAVHLLSLVAHKSGST